MITIFSVNGEYFTNYDLAVLKASGTNYMVKSHDVNDSVDLDVEVDGSDVYVCDEYDNKITVEFQLETFDITSYEDDDECREYRAEDLAINGCSIERLKCSFGLSDELYNSIVNECDNVAIKTTEENV